MGLTKLIKVHCLLHAESEADVPNSLHTLRTINVGFPQDPEFVFNRNFYITRRSVSFFDDSDVANEPIILLDEPETISNARAEHPYFLTDLIYSEDDRYHHVILDPDLIFFDNVIGELDEMLTAVPNLLLGGQHIDTCTRRGMTWMSRIHTHFWFLPDLKTLRKCLDANPFHSPWTPFQPMPPQVVFNNGVPIFFDTGANLFQYLRAWPDLVGRFSPSMHKRYAHVMCGTSFSVVKERLHNPKHYVQLETRHKTALLRPELLIGTNTEYNNIMFQ